ncbi:hypothetical protein ACFWVC_37945 [Streptomyces sp. NPDC058691]|uniref:hypothetical protein n=1 Tax=Streptomyces sp. NPDC058691 TaxID=3346601 RepID=UPI00364CCA4D
MIRRGSAALAALAAVAAVLLWPAAVPAGAVDGCSGVLVVVEDRGVPDAPYPSRTGCAPSPQSGLQALQQAGIAVRLGSGPYGGGFVCALDGAPGTGCAAVDKDTYWSYWYMLPGTSTWVYGAAGPAGRTPVKGGIDAWVWQDSGANEPPSPRSAVPPTPTPRPTRTTTKPGGGASGGGTDTSSGSGTGGSGTGGPGNGGSATGGTASHPAAHPGASTTGKGATPAASASRSADASTSPAPSTSAGSRTEAAGTTGSPGATATSDGVRSAGERSGEQRWNGLPLLVGAVAVAALAGAAVIRARRRDRRPPEVSD